MIAHLRALPVPDPYHLLEAPGLRWGLIGPGRIATDFTTALHRFTRQRIVRVASREPTRAEAFIRRLGIDAAAGTVDQLLDDPGVDVVYIATPHAQHRDTALRVISAGKPVLVEKPFATDAAGGHAIADAAAAAGVFAMEAMWQAFLPRTEAIRRLVADGVLGELRFVEAAFGERFDRQAVPRLWDPAAGGGALLDIGVYPIAFALAWLGPATSTTARGSITADGIDERVQLLLEHGGRAISSLATSIDTALQNRAAISGEHAFIVLDDEFYAPGGFELRTRDEAARWEDPTPLRGRDGLAYQAGAVALAIAEGRTETSEHPPSAAIAALEVVDEARAQLIRRARG